MNPKSRLLTLLEILNNETDDDNPITITGIINRLEAEGFSATRKTVASDIETLLAHNVDIICNKDKGKNNLYFIGNRTFEPPELALLVDAVQAAKFISVKQSNKLIKKLSSQASVHQADKLNRRLYVDKQVKSANENLLYTVDLLHTAINSGVKVSFQYFEYSPQKKKLLKHGGKLYIFSPYAMLWNNDNYYVLGYCESHGKVVTFRVDRMTSAVLLQDKAVPKPKGFKVEDYSKAVFQMWGGEVLQTVRLRCENSLMKSVIDRFGEKVKTEIDGDNHFIAEVDVSVSPLFFGWLVGFSGRIEILSPVNVKERYFETLRQILEKADK